MAKQNTVPKKKQFNYSLIEKHNDDNIFVNGNTKKLSQMNQADLGVLFNNSDPRVKRTPETPSTTDVVVTN